MPLIPAFQRHRQADPYEFEAFLFYSGSSRTTKATQRTPESENILKNIKDNWENWIILNQQRPILKLQKKINFGTTCILTQI